MTVKKYAGIGSRETPEDILQLMEDIAYSLEERGYTLRSGGAVGADQAFESGVRNKDYKEIYLSQDATYESIHLALKYHPNPQALIKKGDYVLGLMGRNMMIISGDALNDDVDFVVCWTKDGKASGGTGQALRYCQDRNIKIFNLFFEETLQELKDYVQQCQ